MCDIPCLPASAQLPSPLTERKTPARVKSRRSSVLTSCRICLSSIFDPAALTCGHRFCESCLDQYWQLKEKPSFLVCPLCRALAYNVDFTGNDKTDTDGEFRKNFSTLHQICDSELNKSTLTCYKISMLIPILYYMMKWMASAIELTSFLRYKFWYKL